MRGRSTFGRTRFHSGMPSWPAFRYQATAYAELDLAVYFFPAQAVGQHALPALLPEFCGLYVRGLCLVRFTGMLDSAGVAYRVDLLSSRGIGSGGWAPATRIGKAICGQAQSLGAAAVVLAWHPGSQDVATYCCRHCMQPVAVLH